MNRKMIFLVAFLLPVIEAELVDYIVECTTTNPKISIDPGNMLFVQSPDFPKSLTLNNSNFPCGFVFSRNDTTNSGIYFIMTAGNTFYNINASINTVNNVDQSNVLSRTENDAIPTRM